MANEPEVKIKFDFETKNAQQKAEIIKQSISEIIADAKKKEQELSAFGGKAIEMSESVALMLERAKAAGKANVEETLATEFASTGLDKALSLGGKVEKYFTALEGLPRLLANVESDAESGALSLEEAYKKVERYKMLLSQLNVEDLSSETGLLNFDLENAAGLDEVLALWERLSTQADQSAADARKIEEAAKQKAQALLEEKNALDVNSEGYQKRANELLKSSMAYEEVGERAAAQATKFDLFKKKLTEALSNVDANEGTKKALELLQEYQVTLGQQAEKTEKVSKQLETVDNERIERLRRADEAAERAEQNAQKRAEAEEKRVQKAEQNAEKEKFAMQLVALSRQELIATIHQLTEAQKEASLAGDKESFKKYTLQIAAARHQLERLKNTTNLSRISMMQQFQTAQQLSHGINTLFSSFSNLSEAAANGTLNLSGLTSTVLSMGFALKAGLGPLAWAMTAVELLTSGWNMYAKSQKEAEEADKKRQERASKLITAYHEAAEAAKQFHEEEARKDVLENTKQWYENVNKELAIARDLTNEIYRNEQARLTLLSREDELEFTLERNKIQREYIAGLISEQQRDEQLDALNVKKAQRKAQRDDEDNKSEVRKAFVNAKDAQAALKNAEEMLATEQKGRRYSVNIFDADKYYTQAEGMRNRYEARAFLEEKLGQYAPEDFERYERLHKAETERVKVAEAAVKELKAKVEEADKLYEAAKKNAEASAKLNEQAILHAETIAKDSKETRKVVREANERKEAQKKADDYASKVIQKTKDNEKLFEEAYWLLSKNNKNKLQESEAKDLSWLLNKGVPASLDGKMTKENLSKVVKLYENALNTATSVDNELISLIVQNLDITKVKYRRLREQISAIKRNLAD